MKREEKLEGKVFSSTILEIVVFLEKRDKRIKDI
jgi:hypothetical protein